MIEVEAEAEVGIGVLEYDAWNFSLYCFHLVLPFFLTCCLRVEYQVG